MTKVTGMRPINPLALSVIVCVSLADASSGAEIDGQVSAGIGVSDNVARLPQNEIDETIGVLGFSFQLTEETRRVRADINTQFDYLQYFDDTFDSEWIGGLSALAEFSLLEDRISWLIQDNFGQQLFDPLGTANPANRENVNFLTTGPTISLLGASRNLFDIDLRYSRIDFEERPLDSERGSAGLRIGREIRRGDTLSLVGVLEDVEFGDSGLVADYDRVDGFVRYEKTGARNQVRIDAGYSQIDLEDSELDGELIRLRWRRELTASSTFSISGGSFFSDQGTTFRFLQGNTTDLRRTADVASSAALYRENSLDVNYTLDRERTTVGIGVSWRQEDYKDASGNDRDISGAELTIQRNLSRRVFGRFGLGSQTRDFKYFDREDDDLVVDLTLGFTFSRAMSATLQYSYWDRSSTDRLDGFEESRVFVRLAYTPNWARQE